MESAYTSRKFLSNNSPIIKNRLRSSRMIHKSKTTGELKRPISGRPTEFYTLSRLLPKNILQDKEKLYEENMRLKLQSHDILAENLQLRTRVKQLESKKKKHDDHDPGLTLVATLKQNIKELNDKIQEKEDEIVQMRRNLRTCKLDEMEIEIKTYRDECARLTSHLNEFMKMNDIPNAYLEYENKIFNKGQVIAKIKKEGQDCQFQLNQAREEITHLKEKIANLERKNKKNSPRSLELNILKDEYESLKATLKKNQDDSEWREKQLQDNINALKEAYEKDKIRAKNLEKESEEKSSMIEKLKKQLTSLKSEKKTFMEPSSFPNTPSGNIQKLKDPPRLFVKINEICKEKNLLISVFLSLLDKNNNGFIEPVELIRGISLHGKYLKKKTYICSS